MNTLKMKVLLIMINRHLWWSVGRAFLIWITTAVLGSFILTGPDPFGMMIFTMIGLLYTSPACIVAIPVIYFLPRIQSRIFRAVFCALAILSVSLITIAVYSIAYNMSFTEVMKDAFPFIIAAVFSVFLMLRNQFEPTKTNSQ